MKFKAIILAAGLGTRMKEYTRDTPKPMLKIGGRPLVEHLVRLLVREGITDIAMNVHYHADQIIDHFQAANSLGANIQFLAEKKPSGTAGGVKKLHDFYKDVDAFLVIYGDLLIDMPLGQLLKNHMSRRSLATICVHQRAKSNSIVRFQPDGLVVSFLERPLAHEAESNTQLSWVNSGIYCFDPSIYTYINDGEIVDFPKDVFPKLIADKELFAVPYAGNRYAIDSEERYLEAQRRFHEFNL
ncbi:MAG TPA: nucleotidyltransferase family protein [Pseudobdellovibrionaceae bacterium]|nr:nucleotidyltransferase family protein [Pseudobdellovibrionaceae bacterium]